MTAEITTSDDFAYLRAIAKLEEIAGTKYR
jgi:hypothetical protein